MVAKDTSGYVIREKTGWGGEGGKEVGWYVGYLETKNRVFYFANCVQIEREKPGDIQRAILFDSSGI